MNNSTAKIRDGKRLCNEETMPRSSKYNRRIRDGEGGFVTWNRAWNRFLVLFSSKQSKIYLFKLFYHTLSII